MTSIRGTEDLHMKRLIEADELGQFDYLVDLGVRLGRDAGVETDGNRIRGCRTAIWVRMEGRKIKASSDSLVVLGLLSIMKEMYDGKNVEEIVSNPMRFLSVISDQVVYPEIRENGIRRVYELITCPKEDPE